jgi:hypothetical protein
LLPLRRAEERLGFGLLVRLRQTFREQLGGGLAPGPRGALPHPLGDRIDLGVGKFAIGGHLPAVVADRHHEVALVGLAGHDRRARLTAAEHPHEAVEP